MALVRVGIVDYLNSRPLAWSFHQGLAPERFEASFHPPAKVAALLAAGELEVGLIPSIEVQRIPDLEVLPGLCVAARREVRSVLLIARKPLEEVRRVALDRNSRTSAALVEIILRDRYGRDPELTSAAPDPQEMLAANDAALVIGDPALQVDRDLWRVFDLAREWRGLTGLPCVFAVWAVRKGAGGPGLVETFEESLRLAERSMPRLIEEVAAELLLDRAEVREYLTTNLSYHLGHEELAGLEEFYRRARSHHLLDEVRPLQFFRNRPGSD